MFPGLPLKQNPISAAAALAAPEQAAPSESADLSQGHHLSYVSVNLIAANTSEGLHNERATPLDSFDSSNDSQWRVCASSGANPSASSRTTTPRLHWQFRWGACAHEREHGHKEFQYNGLADS